MNKEIEVIRIVQDDYYQSNTHIVKLENDVYGFEIKSFKTELLKNHPHTIDLIKKKNLGHRARDLDVHHNKLPDRYYRDMIDSHEHKLQLRKLLTNLMSAAEIAKRTPIVIGGIY